MTAEKAALGTDRPGRALNLTDLTASVHWVLEVQVMELRKKVIGHEHPHTLVSMNSLASTYLTQGRWK